MTPTRSYRPFLLLLVLGFGCPDQESPIADSAGMACGDGVCSADETPETCGVDCGCEAAQEELCGEPRAIAPFGCYCDVRCAAYGDCCADAEPTCGPRTAPGEADPIHIRVLVVVYDPDLPDGRTAREASVATTVEDEVYDMIDFFSRTTSGRVSFEVVDRVEHKTFPVLEDGHQYTAEEWLAINARLQPPHVPDKSDYLTIEADSDICARANRDELDEVWLFGPQWAGFWEAALFTGPGIRGFDVNGPTFEATCNGRIPITLPNPHTMGHRLERTIAAVYGTWNRARPTHNWDRFTTNRAETPGATAWGCGRVHYAPNARCAGSGCAWDDNYDFDIEESVLSYCDDFLNYPYLRDPAAAAQPVSCHTWGCTTRGFETWWWERVPKWAGVGPDGVLNDWWRYLFEPDLVEVR